MLTLIETLLTAAYFLLKVAQEVWAANCGTDPFLKDIQTTSSNHNLSPKKPLWYTTSIYCYASDKCLCVSKYLLYVTAGVEFFFCLLRLLRIQTNCNSPNQRSIHWSTDEEDAYTTLSQGCLYCTLSSLLFVPVLQLFRFQIVSFGPI